MKKTISLILSLVMLLSVCAGMSFNAYAEIADVAFTVPGDLEPVAGTTPSDYDLSKISFTTNSSLVGVYSIFSTEYQYKDGNYWYKVNLGDAFQVGKTYRIKIQGHSSLQNNDTHATNIAVKINDISIPKRDGETPDATSDFFYLNGTRSTINAFHYYEKLTQDVTAVNITNAPTVDPGKEIKLPVGLKIDDHFSITDVDIEVKEGDTWKSAIGKKYECNTKYRFNIAIQADEGYILKNNFTAKVNTSWFSYVNKASEDGKTGVILCEFPNAPAAHKYGTEGDARFTCTVCGKVDAEKKAALAAEEAFAAAQKAIAALPEAAKVTAADKDKIEAARKAYDALTNEQKAKFTAVDYQKLVDAEAALAALTAQQTTTTTTTTTVKNPYTLTFSKISKIKKSAKKTTIKLTLKKNGKIQKSKKVTLTVAGKTYTAKTNKKGVATFTIKKAAVKKLKVNKKTKLVAKYGKNITKTKQVKVVK